MANEKDNKPSKSVDAAEHFLVELKQRAEEAHKANDVFMMGLMTNMIRVVSPLVTRAINRFHREERARLNKMHVELKQNMPKQSANTPPTNTPPANATRNLGG